MSAPVAILLAVLPHPTLPQEGPFERALRTAELSIEEGDLALAWDAIERAQQRDPGSLGVWRLRVDWARKAEDTDELVYSLHRLLDLSVSQGQGMEEEEVAALRAEIGSADPVASELFGFAERYVRELVPLAVAYEEAGRPHSAIQVHKEILALAPEREESRAAIDRIASGSQDPSLAADAETEDLLADVSERWILDHDEEHAKWGRRAKLETPNYVVETNAGYEVLLRSAVAMDQMNAFYRRFFQYGLEEDGRVVPRIALMIFAERDEYLTKGTNTIPWSRGQFTGASVETYTGSRGFGGMVSTLFHEASHQFVSLALPNASGWMNEGLASFFEGTRVLANGAVLYNLPNDRRLLPLVERMNRGWMEGPRDGIDAGDPNVTPETAPTFRIVVENQYEWGPAWYAPTWGVVYFLWNYQDDLDGRFVYRHAFQDFIDETGGRAGKGAVKQFEELVLANSEPPTPGVDFEADLDPVALPEDADALNDVWYAWLSDLAAQRAGSLVRPKPYKQWAMNAMTRGRSGDARELFEKGLVETPNDPELLEAFGTALGRDLGERDRGARLLERALRIHENAHPPDLDAIKRIDDLLVEWDPRRETLQEIRRRLYAEADSLVARYVDGGLPTMGMSLAARLVRQLDRPQLLPLYESALEAAGAPIETWELAYDEESLRGWSASVEGTYEAKGAIIEGVNGRYDPDNFDFRFLTLDTVISGNYSLEAEVLVNPGEITFSGLVFGQKSSTTYHALILFPPKQTKKESARSGFLDLASFFQSGSSKTWRHVPVETGAADETTSSGWHSLRLDVTGKVADVWYDGEHVTSHEFPTRDTLIGNVGLITGAGRGAYRDIRYASRPPGDRTAEVDRAFRLRDLVVTNARARDDWASHPAPWLEADRWLQAPREGWKDRGAVPQLLVMWSIRQNDLIPIDGWLRWLEEQHQDVGLEILSVVSIEDAEEIDGYLQETGFPGSVALDTLKNPQVRGFGDTFELFKVGETHNLPLCVLIDLDGKVVWQGEPGLTIGDPWDPAKQTFLDEPLAELIEGRKLRELTAWRERWLTEGVAHLRAADLSAAVPLMIEALQFDAPDPHVAKAQALYMTLETSLRNADATARTFVAKGCDPAVEAFVACARELEEPIDVNRARNVRLAMKSPVSKAWERALNTIAPLHRKTDSSKPWNTMDRILGKLDDLPGVFVAELRDDLARCRDEDDVDALAEVLETAELRPGQWLLRHHFDWSLEP